LVFEIHKKFLCFQCPLDNSQRTWTKCSCPCLLPLAFLPDPCPQSPRAQLFPDLLDIIFAVPYVLCTFPCLSLNYITYITFLPEIFNLNLIKRKWSDKSKLGNILQNSSNTKYHERPSHTPSKRQGAELSTVVHPVIPVTLELEAGGSRIWGQLGQR
jgi:hypothetical protein